MERTGKELLIASRSFAQENRLKSWWYFWSTLSLLVLLLAIAGLPYFPLIARVSASVLSGFLLIRTFVIYHDFFHGAILRGSRVAHAIMYLFGLVILSPPNSWKSNHDHHHKQNSNLFGAEVGGFPVMTTIDYGKSSRWRQIGYRLVRSPLTILFGYFTSFLVNKTLIKFLRNPCQNLTCGLSLLVHFGLVILIGMYSINTLLLGMLIPIWIATAAGSYLFYAQHNFPGMKRKQGKEWDYVYAALHSSSFLKLSPLMNWITGNIGYHHVHHLNAKIPFYRLPEAMNNLQELQTPVSTSLKTVDIFRCLQLKLWDPISEQLLTFREAKLLAAEMGG